MQSIVKRQHGLTLISLILLLGMIAIVVTLILKIGPIYLEHRKVKSALEEIKELSNLDSMSESEIRSTLDKRLGMNYVTQVKSQDFKIAKRGSYMKIEGNYEVVENIAGNLNALVQFNDKVEVGQE